MQYPQSEGTLHGEPTAHGVCKRDDPQRVCMGLRHSCQRSLTVITANLKILCCKVDSLSNENTNQFGTNKVQTMRDALQTESD